MPGHYETHIVGAGIPGYDETHIVGAGMPGYDETHIVGGGHARPVPMICTNPFA